MGTRNLTMVVCDGELKVSQYGQWDGYPEGQGKTCLEFLRAVDLEHFRTAVRGTRQITEEELHSLGDQAGVPRNSKWITREQSDRLKALAPWLSRDTGATILRMVNSGQAKFLNIDNGFLTSGMGCEWAYRIDLDANTLEVLCGGDNKVASFSLADLPSNEAFFAACNEGASA